MLEENRPPGRFFYASPSSFRVLLRVFDVLLRPCRCEFIRTRTPAARRCLALSG